MVLECVKTCVIHASEMVASYEKARVIALLRECIDFEVLSAIQFCPRGLIRVTFKDASDMEEFVRVGSLTLDGHDLSVTSSEKPHSLVYVHYFPAEGDDALIRDELGKYGDVISIKHESFSGIPGLLTGSRILTMVLSDPVPAEFGIDDYPVRVWYKGIPPFCQICKISGHKAADCQFNGKCRRCGSPDHKAHACVRPWGQSAVPMVVAVPEVVPDPPVAVVPAVSDSSAVLDEGVDETVEEEEVADEEDVAVVEDVEDEVTDAEDEDEVPVNTHTGVPVPSPSGRVLGTAPSVPVAEKVQASSGPVAPVVPVAVSGPSGSPVGSSQSVPADSGLSRVALSRVITPELRREFFWGYRDMLCQCSRNAAYVISYRNTRVCEVFPADDPDEVRITFESGAFLIVHANLVRISKADTSNEVSEEEFAKFLLSIRTDPSYWISFRGTIVADVGPTEHSNVLCATFVDHTGPQSRRLLAKALSVTNVALISNSSVNNVNEFSSTVDDGIVNVSRISSCSVVPTAAVLAAELLKRTTPPPPSVVGVPKCRKKL